MTVVTRFKYEDGGITELVFHGDSQLLEITHSAAGCSNKSEYVVEAVPTFDGVTAAVSPQDALDEENLNPMAAENLFTPDAEFSLDDEPAYTFGEEQSEENLNPMAAENLFTPDAEFEEAGFENPTPAPPLGVGGPAAPAVKSTGKAVPAVVRGAYTFLFSLLGMAGAAFAYLRENLSSIADFKWQTIAIFVVGALLAGIGYGLKKYWKPDGVL